MARGPKTTSSVTAVPTSRELRTDALLEFLASCTDESERAAVTEELVELNLGLCDALANRYAHRGADRDDLVQVARVALVLAVRRFRPAEGRSFVAFAVPTITGEIKRYFRDHCWVVRPPRRIQELRARASQHGQQLEQRLGRRASTAELVCELGVDAQLVREATAADGSYRPWSLDAPLDGEGEMTFGATLAEDADTDRLVDRIALQRALAGLSRREQLVLKWRFEDGCTQSEIGRRLGVSQMQVSRILRRSLDRARDALSEDEPLAG
ncbi:sigma-70 family RNA polymerase sigma factor [Propionicimonas sp.]|uniref:sigma-70 family RNA polymerase sigma factor n=1 Tax=Propionicimonas sp. TaxID=1955623 RepID=UPI0039E6A773